MEYDDGSMKQKKLAFKADHFDNVGLYTSHDDSVYLIYHKFNEMIENAAQSLKMQFTFKLDTD